MALFKGKKRENKESAKADSSKTGQSKTKGASMKDLYADKKTTKSTTKSNKSTVGIKKRRAYEILVKPLITEKAAGMSEANKYVFEVSRGANKIEISHAIFEVYGVKPTAVNIANFKGKKVTQGQKRGKRKNWKKAIVTLAKGETINIYEGV